MEIDINAILNAAEKKHGNISISEIVKNEPETKIAISSIPYDLKRYLAKDTEDAWDVRIQNMQIDEMIEDIRLELEESK